MTYGEYVEEFSYRLIAFKEYEIIGMIRVYNGVFIKGLGIKNNNNELYEIDGKIDDNGNFTLTFISDDNYLDIKFSEDLEAMVFFSDLNGLSYQGSIINEKERIVYLKITPLKYLREVIKELKNLNEDNNVQTLRLH